MTGKGHEGTFWVMIVFCVLIRVWITGICIGNCAQIYANDLDSCIT